jgi:hypothetical protein
MWKKVSILFLPFLYALFAGPIWSQQSDSTDDIYYSGETYIYRITAPIGWVFDLENAQLDGRSAACYPKEQKYYDFDRIVYIWIFKRDSLSFREFMTADSARYLRRNPGLSFRRADSVMLSQKRKIFLLEAADPGGKSNIASVAYADVNAETIIFELNITRPVLFAETESIFIKMLKKISLTKREE